MNRAPPASVLRYIKPNPLHTREIPVIAIRYCPILSSPPADKSAYSAIRPSPATRRVLATFICALAVSLTAQQPISLADADQRGQNIFAQSAATGMVLVVVRGRESMIKTYGETFPDSGHNPDTNSEIRL